MPNPQSERRSARTIVAALLTLVVASAMLTLGTGAASALPTPTSVDAVIPLAGPIEGGRTVVIRGASLTTTVGAFFDGIPGTGFTHINNTTVSVVTPAHALGTVDITLQLGGGSFTAVNPDDEYTYEAAPTVTSVSPSAGPVVGGNIVTITGTNFLGADQDGGGEVDFDSVQATNILSVTATSIVAMAPLGHPGPVDITVSTASGTSPFSSADKYTYAAPPSITAVAPTVGPESGGTSVVITGAAFTAASAVKFGSTDASSFVVNSDTQVTAVTPAGTGTQDVSVQTAGGIDTDANAFTYLPHPTVTSISPAAGPLAGGTSVTVAGTGFTDVSGVSFGPTAATSFTVNSDHSITATAPPGTGTVDVAVTTLGGASAATASDEFAYRAAPIITVLSSSTGSVDGGSTITITGSGFTDATSVTFGGVAAPDFTVNSDRSITVTTPAHGTGEADIVVSGAGGASAAANFVFVADPTARVLGFTGVDPSTTLFAALLALLAGALAVASRQFVGRKRGQVDLDSAADTEG